MLSADRALLDADGWFGSLPAGRRDALLAEAHVRAVAAGGSIYGLGDPPNGLWAVVAGQVRLKGHPVAGHEFLALILRPGTWFGELSTLDGGPRPHDAAAFGAARVAHVSMAAFHRAAEAMPGLYRDLGRLVCLHQRLALDYIAQVVSLPLRARIARLLTSRTHEDGGLLHVRQEEIAVMLGVSRQTLNRHLRDLERQGVIDLGYGRIGLRDREALRAAAAGGA